MATNVLQLGGRDDWSEKYKMSDEITWNYNNFPPKKPAIYSVVIIDGAVNLTPKNWEKLIWASTPYAVFYRPGTEKQLGAAGQRFIKLDAGKPFTCSPEQMIKDISDKYYFGQTGIRVLPNNINLNQELFDELNYPDGGHLQLSVDSDEWQTFGHYRNQLYVDPYRRLRIWLEASREPGVELRIVVNELVVGDRQWTFPVTTKDAEEIIPTKLQTEGQFVSVSLQMRGHSKFTLGPFHYSWARYGAGIFIVGAKRLIEPHNGEQVAYYLNPGNLKPPLNVYFSGARSAEGFEAYPLFRSFKAPSLLFTDPRLEIGQFYTGDYMEPAIKRVIMRSLLKLGMTTDDLVMCGVSMGTYPAIKLGSELGAHAIVVAKALTNLGYLAERGRLQRPDEFETIFDIDRQLTQTDFPKGLHEIDQKFWRQFDEDNLARTRLFITHMYQDDYDDRAVAKIKSSNAIQHVKEFATKGYPGHHNDNTDGTVSWMIYRIRQVMRDDFGNYQEDDQ